MTSISTHFVKPGACFENGEFKRCALDQAECGNGDYVAWRMIDVVEEDAKSCTVKDITVARCTHNHQCATDHEVCLSGHQFELNATCTVFSDTVTGEYTKYGRCRNKKIVAINQGETDVCVWRKIECSDFEDWLPDPFCDCSKVVTGACKQINGIAPYYCAVSESACAEDDVFVPYYELEAEGIRCRLCEADDVEIPNFPVPAIPRNPGTNQTSGSSWLIAGGVLIGIGLLSFLGTRMYMKKINKDTVSAPVPNENDLT